MVKDGRKVLLVGAAGLGSLERSYQSAVETIPLAADPELHAVKDFTSEELEPFKCDVSFIGSWRPERAALLEHFEGLKVRVWGSSDWVRFTSKHSPVRQWWQGRPLFGQEMVKAVRASTINLNLRVFGS